VLDFLSGGRLRETEGLVDAGAAGAGFMFVAAGDRC
jgi:hypothetical protein